MTTRRKPKRKTPGLGLLCQRCGDPLYVTDTKPRKGVARIDRTRQCRSCGWECETEERIVVRTRAA